MKVLVLYRPRSEHRAVVEEFLRAFKEQYSSARLEVFDVDRVDGDSTAKLYDFMDYPVVAVLREDGSLLQSWVGVDSIPSAGDVNYFASSQL